MSYRYAPSADRFSNYRELSARRAELGSCSHPIQIGDRIGWHPKLKKTYCAECWRRWVNENDEAERIERQSPYGGY